MSRNSSSQESSELNHGANSLPARSSATPSPQNSGNSSGERGSTSPVVTPSLDSEERRSGNAITTDKTGGTSPIVDMSYPDYEGTVGSSTNEDETRPGSAPNLQEIQQQKIVRSASAPARIGR